ncbi:YegP family protein [Azospirillum sp.]|uniref:YegP family protein n=1 Tax=Azospirillum sp. TaxID=34012 RepID=UPI002D2C891C|nr:YegP family protein [Azospirillum sp.]HYD67601.1 YegP family protein [Azospirillum sp.]
MFSALTKSGLTFYYKKDAKGEWRWRLKHSNGNIIADSGEGYKNKEDCLHGISLVQSSSTALIKEEH